MFNLDKLNVQIDLNNIDAAQIVNILTEHQKVIMIIFLVGALVLAAGMFKDYHTKEQSLRTQMSQEQTKQGVIKSRESAIQDFNSYISTLPPEINELDLITEISDDANLHHVTIASLNPGDKKEAGLYSSIDVTFSAVSDNFKDTMLFLRALEKSNPPLRVNSWTGNESEDGKITSNIQLSAIHIHT